MLTDEKVEVGQRKDGWNYDGWEKGVNDEMMDKNGSKSNTAPTPNYLGSGQGDDE